MTERSIVSASTSTSVVTLGAGEDLSDPSDDTGTLTPLEVESRNSNEHRLCCMKYDNIEITGMALGRAARGATLIAGIFIGESFLTLATRDAGCEGLEPDECDTKVYGLNPSSILTLSGTVVGLAAAVTTPAIGAIMDYTTWRWPIGAGSAFAILFVNFLQIFTWGPTWFAMYLLQYIQAYAYIVNECAQMAYLPELTDSENEIIRITSHFNASFYSSEVSFLILVVILCFVILGGLEDAIGRGIIGQTCVVLVSGPLFYLSWKRLGSRQPQRQIKEGGNLLLEGYRQIGRTMKTLLLQHRPVFWLYLAVSFAQAAMSAFATIVVTYTKQQLKMDSSTFITLACIVIAIPSAIISKWITKSLGGKSSPNQQQKHDIEENRKDEETAIDQEVSARPYVSYMLSIFYWGIVTLLSQFVLRSEDDAGYTYVFAVLWGIGFGWTGSVQQTSICQIIPPGQEAELMSLYSGFACSILNWLPPLVFFAMIEAGIPMYYGLTSLAGFFFVAVLAGLLLQLEEGGYTGAAIKARQASSKSLTTGDKSQGQEEKAPIA